MKRKVLILNGQYWPGYKGGGPIRSMVNMVDNLGEEFEFYVITSDRDFKSDKPYENVKINEWNKVGNALVYYMSENRQTFRDFKNLINSVNYDVMYLNGFFSPIYTIKPLILNRLNKLKNNNIILTPRGDFSGGLEVKRLKKYLYIYLVKLLGIYNNLIWHATSELEEKDIKKIFKNAKIVEASNLPSKLKDKSVNKIKTYKELKLVFISRIHRKKNLLKTLELLYKSNIKDNIEYDIFGPIEDQEYWNACLDYINRMPTNIKVTYKGEINHSEVEKTLENYHCLFFPTLGENYGHIIVESMYSGCLVLISDTTPWIDLEKVGIGWSIPLNEDDKYLNALHLLLNLDEHEFNKRANKAIQYCLTNCKNEKIINKYKNLLG